MSKQKRKGDNYERELAAYISEFTGLSVSRAPLSGGGKVNMYGTADLIGTPSLFVEAKRVERLNFHDALRQAERNIVKTKAQQVPMVINRRSQMKTRDSLCLIRLGDFLKFYTAYLRVNGYVRDDPPDSL